jgi:hypothetical protein
MAGGACGSGDDPTLLLELTKCLFGPDADLPEVSHEEQAAYDKHVEETYTPEWFKTATGIEPTWFCADWCGPIPESGQAEDFPFPESTALNVTP